MANTRKELKVSDQDRWYLVGLIAADGCLSSDGRHINITSKDYDFLAKLIISFGLSSKVGIKNKGQVNQAYYLEFSNRSFYEFLLSIGLTPRKSLTLARVDVPEEWFADFLRGVIDGDGSIRNWIHPSNGIEQWSLRVYSASRPFVEWLGGQIEKQFEVTGAIHQDVRKGPKSNLFVLKYGKIAAKVILGECYYKGSLGLERKARLAGECRISSAK